MDTVQLRGIEQILVSASLETAGIAVSFADGCRGVIPYTALQDLVGRSSIASLELDYPHELVLYSWSGKQYDISWDLARWYCDEKYRTQTKAQTMAMMKGIGERIRRIRNSAGVSQREVANAVGTSQASISRIERGEKFASSSTIIAIAKALAKTPWELYAEPEVITQTFTNDDAPPDAGTQLMHADLLAWTQVQANHEEELEAVESAISHVYVGIDKVAQGFARLSESHDAEPILKQVEEGMNLTARVFKSIRAAHLLCGNGSFEQTLDLLRTALEHVYTGLGLAVDPYLGERLRARKRINQGGYLKDLVEKLNIKYPRLELLKRWEFLNNELSEYKHSGGTYRQQIPTPTIDGYAVPFVPFYNAQLARRSLDATCHILYLLIVLVQFMSTAVGEHWEAEAAWQPLFVVFRNKSEVGFEK